MNVGHGGGAGCTRGFSVTFTGAFGVTTCIFINCAVRGFEFLQNTQFSLTWIYIDTNLVKLTYLHGQGKYRGISQLVTLLPLSLTKPEPVVFRTLSGLEHMKRCPQGHSYSTPTKIFTLNSVLKI